MDDLENEKWYDFCLYQDKRLKHSDRTLMQTLMDIQRYEGEIPYTLKEIAEMIYYSYRIVLKAVSRLEDLGYINPGVSQQDRRVKAISLGDWVRKVVEKDPTVSRDGHYELWKDAKKFKWEKKGVQI